VVLTWRFAMTTPAMATRSTPAWRAAFLEFPDRFLLGTDTFTPERWHYVVEHARVVARMAGRFAEGRRREDRLAQRRSPVRIDDGG
jgi:hypothetical protein